MKTQYLIVVSSKTAWVDPSVQVHDAGCNHGMMRWYDNEWLPSGPFDSETQAVTVSEGLARQIGATNVTWCDCTLTTGQVS